MATQKAVPGAPGIYLREGKRRSTYSAVIAGKYTPLGHDLDQAKQQLAKLLELPTVGRTVEAMCLAFLAEQKRYLATNDPEALSPRTVSDYEISLTRFIIPVFGHMHPDEVTRNHIAKYLKDGRTTRRTRVNRDRSALSSAYKFGLAEGLAKSNPCLGVPRNSEKPRKRLVTIDEFNGFLSHAKAKGGSAYMVALIGCTVALTGRRRAEIIGLTRSALLPEGFRVKDCKTKAGEPERHYLVEWSDLLRQVINEVLSIKRRVSSLFLFATDDGTPYQDSGFSTLWQRLMHSYAPGGPKSPEWFTAHDLRALYVTNMLAQQRNPNTHKDEATMLRVYERSQVIKVSPLA